LQADRAATRFLLQQQEVGGGEEIVLPLQTIFTGVVTSLTMMTTTIHKLLRLSRQQRTAVFSSLISP